MALITKIKKHPVFTDYGADIDGNVYSFKFNKIKKIKHKSNGRGYRQFRVYQLGKTRIYNVHRFTYECISGKLIDLNLQCHHKDHNKENNSFNNLELVDQLMNMHYGKIAGILYGAASPKHKYYKK